ncbi:MAG: 50S ribosomal protein L24e [Candidatus Thorarchaeota archaeon]
MVGTQRCTFCGRDIEPGTGIAFVRTKDGAVLWFCSNKCKVSSIDRGMKPRETKWTLLYQKGVGTGT